MKFKSSDIVSNLFRDEKDEKDEKFRELIRLSKLRLGLLSREKHRNVMRTRAEVAQIYNHRGDLNGGGAYEKAQRIYTEERMGEIYVLLNHYLEVVTLYVPYIFVKHKKKCPDYVREALSTLIYASGYLEELPELWTIRKMLEKRYGKKFVKTELKLRPGNHVKFRSEISEVVYEYLSIKPIDPKAVRRLMEEIASSCESGTVEYQPYLEDEKVIERSVCKVSSSCEEEHVLVDVGCETTQFLEHCCDDEEDSGSESETYVLQSPQEVTDRDDPGRIVWTVSSDEDSASDFETYDAQLSKEAKYLEEDSGSESETNTVQSPREVIDLDDTEKIVWSVSSDEESASDFETYGVQLSKEAKYLEESEEIESSLGEEGILHKPSSFEFKPSGLPLKEETYKRSYNDLGEHSPSRNTLKMRQAGRHIRQRKMASIENIFDFESAVYYGYLKEA